MLLARHEVQAAKRCRRRDCPELTDGFLQLLDFGALDASIQIADYKAHELAAAYKQTILVAVEQVDGAPRFPFVGDNTTVTELDTIMEAMGWR